MNNKDLYRYTGYSLEEIKHMFKHNAKYIYQNQLIIGNKKVYNGQRRGFRLKSNEIFVAVPRHDGYFISQYGRVISYIKGVYRLIKQSSNGNNNYAVIRQWVTKGHAQDKYVHRMVAEIFCYHKEQTLEGLEVHHLDRNRHNNYYKNLVVVTHREHKIFHYWSNSFLLYNMVEKNGWICNLNWYDLVWITDITPTEFAQSIMDHAIDGAKSVFTYKNTYKIGAKLYSLPFGKKLKNSLLKSIYREDAKNEEHNGFLRGKRLDLYREVWKEWPN